MSFPLELQQMMMNGEADYICEGPRLPPPYSRHRKGCGYVLDKIIKAFPRDGQEYPFTCPRCGKTDGKVRRY